MSDDDCIEQAMQFLAALFRDDDWIEFRLLPGTVSRWVQLARRQEVSAALQWAMMLNSREDTPKNVYVGVNPRADRNLRGDENVTLARSVFADFDGGCTVPEAMQRVEAARLPRPSFVIESGGGVHCYWLLTDDVHDLAKWSAAQRGIARAAGSDRTIHNPERIMRLPGLRNVKESRPGRPRCRVVKWSDALHDIEAFPTFAPPALATQAPARLIAPGSMGRISKEFFEGTGTLPSGRRQTMFTVACDLAARGWKLENAVPLIMKRMADIGLTAEELADCPRQIRNAFNKPREPAAGGTMNGHDFAESDNGVADDEHDFEIVPSGGEDEPCDDVAEEDLWKPFPVELLPAVVGEYVGEAAASIGGDPSMIALPMLSSLAAAIGNTYAVELKRNWHEPAIVWSMVVGESGSSKSPCFRAALSFANDLDAENAPRNADARAGHHDELQRHKAALSAWQAQAKKSPGDAGDPPREPEPPADIAYTVSDATIEALIHKLASNPRGLLLARDELSGWLAGFDRYSSGSGKVSGDAAQWLELHNAGRVVVDRRHAGRIEVQKAAVSVAGGIQPRTLIKALGGEHVDNGLLARFVLAMPPQSPLAWSEDEPSIFVVQSMRDLLASLYAIPFTGSPKVCTLTAEGKAAWVQFFNDHQQAKAAERGPVASMMAKAEATAARLALICHLVRNATVAPVLQDEIDTDDLERGIGLARWFAHEWRRVYRALVGPDVGGSDVGGDDPRSLVEWLEDRGGDMPVRTIYKSGPRRYRDKAEQVERLVGKLVRAGRVESYSRPSDAGGQPARWVRLPR